MLTTCRNALSVLDLLVKVIGSAVVASTFSSWTAGGVWGFVVVSTIARTIRNWERQEGVIEYFRDAGEPTETTGLVNEDANRHSANVLELVLGIAL